MNRKTHTFITFWVGALLILAAVVALPVNAEQTTWGAPVLVDTDEVGDYSSLALDASGNLHISYLDLGNSALKYAFYNGTGWQIETVDSESSIDEHTSLALDSSGNPHISYFDASNEDLK